jgi:hypothetical protein
MCLGQLLSPVVVVVFDRLPLAGLSGMFLAMLNMTMDSIPVALILRSMTDYVCPIMVMRREMFDIAN